VGNGNASSSLPADPRSEFERKGESLSPAWRPGANCCGEMCTGRKAGNIRELTEQPGISIGGDEWGGGKKNR